MHKKKKKKNQQTLPGLQPRFGRGDRTIVGPGFSLDPMPKAVNSQKALQRLATTEGFAVMVQPQAGKHVTMVTLAGKGGDGQQSRVRVDTGGEGSG